MELQGKIIAALPPRSGVSANGTQWQVNTYVIETAGDYPRKMAFEVFGADKVEKFNIQLNEELVVSFDIDAREYQGRWFNSIRAWKVERPNAGQAMQPTAQPSAFAGPFPPAQQQTQQQQAPAQQQGQPNDDLPF